MKRAILIDGNSIIYKCFYSIEARKKELEGEKLKENFFSLFQFQLKKLLRLQKYSLGAILFDSDRKSFRTELEPEYKQNREPMPEELLSWLPEINKVSRECGLNPISAPKGYEADDLIGTFAKGLGRADCKVDIFSTDKDLLQLVDYLVSVYRVKKSFQLELNNHLNFSSLNNELLPFQIPLLKALTGDSADNYKGVPNIGPKTALKLIKEFNTKERLLSNIDSIKEGKVKTALKENLEQLKNCLELAEIQTNIKFKYTFEDFELKA